MRICPTCRTAYPARGRATCAKDGTRLVDANEYAASKNDPLLGRNVTGRFAIVERIGTGGMGTVYRADQSGLDRPVALKVLKKELITDSETVARFHREAKAMSMLMHPNTVRVFDFGEDTDGHLFLAMELLEGDLLTAWIEHEGRPPIDESVETTRQILASLSEAHSKGLVHRDLKPDNIMLARVEGQARPVVKVLDFGIAKVFRAEEKIDQLETQAGTVFGTPRYMSPEQAQGKDLDHRSDLYSVGVLLYQMLTGHPPFVDDDAVVVMAKHIREMPEPVREAAEDRPIPRSLAKIVDKALAKEPKDRYANADEFEAALAACLPDVAEEAERFANGRPSRMMSAVRDLPRVPMIIGAALVGVATLTAVTLVLLSGPADPGPRPRETITEVPPAANPAPDEPEEQRLTTVHIRTTPDNAEVYRDGALEGNGRVDVEVSDTPVQVRVASAGYIEQSFELTSASDAVRIVELARAPEPEPVTEPSRPTGRRRSRRRTEGSNTEQGSGSPTPTDPYGGRWDD